MTRRSSRLIAIIALAGLASGCATFSDNDLAAKVGGAELSHDELGEQLAEADGSDTTGDRVSGTLARTEIDDWIRRAVADQVGLFDRYAAADGSLAIACFYVLPVADRAQADDVVSRLAAGEQWDDVAASVSPDAAAQSRQPCGPVAGFIPEVAETLASLEPGGAAQVIEATDPPGVFVVRAHTEDELDMIEFLTSVSEADPVLLEAFVERLRSSDVYVDPRFGDFDPERLSVIPLG